MVEARPFVSTDDLFGKCVGYLFHGCTFHVAPFDIHISTAASDRAWSLSEKSDILEAFSAHPKIGDSKGAAQHGGVSKLT